MRNKSSRLPCMPLIMLCWLAYSISYLGKVNYAANISLIIEYYGITHAEAGLVSTMFFFAYGAGQIVNAFLVKRYNLRWVVFSALFSAGLINLAVGLCRDFTYVKYLWVLNGVALSMLWPSLIRLLSESVPRNKMSKATVAMGTTVATGTLIIYGLSALYATFTDFRLSFYTAAVAMIAVSFLWLLLVPKATALAKSMPDDSLNLTAEGTGGRSTARRLVLIACGTLALFGIATNLIKDGLVTWVPSILKEQFHLPDSMSIVLTLALPVVAVFGNAFSVTVNKIIKDLVLLAGLCFTVSGVILGAVVLFVDGAPMPLILTAFAVVTFLASTCNSIITSIFPLYMKKELNSGFVAGILNGFCYLGSTISSYGLGAVADNSGWHSVFVILFAVCVTVFAVSGLYIAVTSFIKRAATGERK